MKKQDVLRVKEALVLVTKFYDHAAATPCGRWSMRRFEDFLASPYWADVRAYLLENGAVVYNGGDITINLPQTAAAITFYKDLLDDILAENRLVPIENELEMTRMLSAIVEADDSPWDTQRRLNNPVARIYGRKCWQALLDRLYDEGIAYDFGDGRHCFHLDRLRARVEVTKGSRLLDARTLYRWLSVEAAPLWTDIAGLVGAALDVAGRTYGEVLPLVKECSYSHTDGKIHIKRTSARHMHNREVLVNQEEKHPMGLSDDWRDSGQLAKQLLVSPSAWPSKDALVKALAPKLRMTSERVDQLLHPTLYNLFHDGSLEVDLEAVRKMLGQISDVVRLEKAPDLLDNDTVGGVTSKEPNQQQKPRADSAASQNKRLVKRYIRHLANAFDATKYAYGGATPEEVHFARVRVLMASTRDRCHEASRELEEALEMSCKTTSRKFQWILCRKRFDRLQEEMVQYEKQGKLCFVYDDRTREAVFIEVHKLSERDAGIFVGPLLRWPELDDDKPVCLPSICDPRLFRDPRG